MKPTNEQVMDYDNLIWKRTCFKLWSFTIFTIILITLLILTNNVFASNSQFEEWQSLDELKEFLSADDTDQTIYLKADSSGQIQLNGQCETLAFQLRDRAFEKNRLIETEILTPSEYTRYFNKQWSYNNNDGHFICKAIIKNEVYFIDPSTDKIWLAYKTS